MDIARSDIVKSIAGRDQGKYFFVLDVDGEFLLLADGKTRKMAHSDACGNEPKKFGYITLSGDKVAVEAPKTAAKTADPMTIALVSLAMASGAAFISKKRK